MSASHSRHFVSVPRGGGCPNTDLTRPRWLTRGSVSDELHRRCSDGRPHPSELENGRADTAALARLTILKLTLKECRLISCLVQNASAANKPHSHAAV